MSNTTQTISLDSLTPSQLSELRKQIAERASQNSANREKRNAIVDTMLQEQENGAFKHTTSDILAKLQAESLVPKDADRPTEIKKIQTRKQLLEKKDGMKGKVGYKQSEHVFGPKPINASTVAEWLCAECNADKLDLVITHLSTSKSPSAISLIKSIKALK